MTCPTEKSIEKRSKFFRQNNIFKTEKAKFNRELGMKQMNDEEPLTKDKKKISRKYLRNRERL